jgi:hypothetical protein
MTVRFKKIAYKDLSSKKQEIYNFQKIAGVLASYGYTCIKLSDDWNGADFLAHRFDGKETFGVQLKSRITVEKKYCNKKLWIAFKDNAKLKISWYLVPHDDLLAIIKQHTNWMNSDAWKKGGYSAHSLSEKLRKPLEKYLLLE